MDPATYEITLRQAYLVAEVLVNMKDLPEAIRAADLAETTGPLLDPTAYMRKRKALSEDLEVLRILRDCQAELVKAGVKPSGEVS